MHGIIVAELKNFVTTKFGGEATWQKLLASSGLAGRTFLPIRAYPDEHVVALVTAASAATGKPAAELLEDFGAFIVPGLTQLYGALINPKWRTLDVIANTEETIHKVVRSRDAAAAPPELQVTRKSPTEVEIVYGSPRKMCAVAKGISRGLAAHFKETVSITESACMHSGAPKCRISVRSA